MTVTVNTDVLQVSSASFTPASGLLELNVWYSYINKTIRSESKQDHLTLDVILDGQATDHYYPRNTIDTSTISGAVYTPSTGVLSCTTTAGHGLTDGDWIQI